MEQNEIEIKENISIEKAEQLYKEYEKTMKILEDR